MSAPLTDLQLRALRLLAADGAFCRHNWTTYCVHHHAGISSLDTGARIAARTLWSLVDRKLLAYSTGDLTITDAGRAALARARGEKA